MYENLKDTVKSLEHQINNQNIGKDKLAKYKHYYLGLKKDLRLFEEAIDEITYGVDEKVTKKDIKKEPKANKENDIDLLTDPDMNVGTNTKNKKVEKDVNLLDLDVEVDTLDLHHEPKDTQIEPVQPQVPIQEEVYVHREAFDFLSDKPSAEDFINIK